MVSALDRKLLRDLSRLKGQVVTIALVVACGVATFLTFVGAYRSLSWAQEVFYEHTRFADVFAGLKRAPRELEAEIREIPGVGQIETRVVVPVTLDVPGSIEPVRGRLVSLPETGKPFLNAPLLRAGRMPELGCDDEVLASEPFANAHQLRPGDAVHAVVEGKLRTFRMVGIALSPEYVFAIAPGQMLHDDERFGVFWAHRDALAAAYGMEGAFDDVAIRLAPGASVRAVIARLDDVLRPYGGFGAVSRDDQSSHHFVKGELEELQTWAFLMPAIFVGVAAFLLNIVLSRLVGTQREQIAALKAFGYTNVEIALHYLKLIGFVVVLGSVIGTGLGWFFGVGITGRYSQFFRFPDLAFRMEASTAIAGAAITLAAAAVGGLSAVRAAVRLAPAEAMQPPRPARYRRSLLERIGLQALLSNVGRITARNLGRRPLRASLSVLGIGFATAIVVAGLFMGDAIDRLMNHQFGRVQHEDLTITFRQPLDGSALRELETMPGIQHVEGARIAPIEVRVAHRTKKIVLFGLEPGALLRRVFDGEHRVVTLPKEGIVLTKWLAEHLGVGVGDVIRFEVLEGSRTERTVKVADVADELFGLAAYMRIDALHRTLGEQESVSAAHVTVDPRAMPTVLATLKDKPSVAGTTTRTAIFESFQSMTGAWMTMISAILSGFAATIAFGVVYNTARIGLAERERELASLRVLGFTIREITWIFVGELAVLVLLGIPLGYGLGWLLVWFITRQGNVEGYRFPVVFEADTLAYAAVVVALSGIVSALVVRRKLHDLDLVGVLKTRD